MYVSKSMYWIAYDLTIQIDCLANQIKIFFYHSRVSYLDCYGVKIAITNFGMQDDTASIPHCF